jgi:protein O-GlcNAc transferase
MGRHKVRPGRRAQIPRAVSPQTLDQVLALALRCQDTGHLEEAKQLYIRILEQQPDHAEALSNLGTIAGAAGDFALALALAERSVAQCPDNAQFRVVLAWALYGAGHRARADEELQTALRLDLDCV